MQLIISIYFSILCEVSFHLVLVVLLLGTALVLSSVKFCSLHVNMSILTFSKSSIAYKFCFFSYIETYFLGIRSREFIITYIVKTLVATKAINKRLCRKTTSPKLKNLSQYLAPCSKIFYNIISICLKPIKLRHIGIVPH